MAFAQGSTTKRNVTGNRRMNYGTFSQANTDTGGDFVTGLQRVEYFECTGLKTYTESAGTVTATTLDPGGAQAGFWMAIGV